MKPQNAIYTEEYADETLGIQHHAVKLIGFGQYACNVEGNAHDVTGAIVMFGNGQLDIVAIDRVKIARKSTRKCTDCDHPLYDDDAVATGEGLGGFQITCANCSSINKFVMTDSS